MRDIDHADTILDGLNVVLELIRDGQVAEARRVRAAARGAFAAAEAQGRRDGQSNLARDIVRLRTRESELRSLIAAEHAGGRPEVARLFEVEVLFPLLDALNTLLVEKRAKARPSRT